MKTLLSSLITLWVIITLTFVLMKALPGDPFTNEQALPDSIHQSLIRHYGLDDPIGTQYVRYLSNLFKGDLGPSFKYQDRTVNRMIQQGAPISMWLGLQAFVLSLAVGIPLGMVAAIKKQQWPDRLILISATIAISIPSFILATLLQYILGVKLQFFPIARWGSFAQTVMPTLALAALPAAFLAKLVRASMLQVLSEDYMTLSFSKGIPRWRTFYSHGFKNALLPLFPYLGQLATAILTGSFIIEKIFAIPGLGQTFVTSVLNRDYTVIMGLTCFYSIILIVMTIFADLLQVCLDPRLRRKLCASD